ncbi:hypothetical protein DFJ73DRAFT_793725 [Zopfochytrium polystomum]|nr:hypothetical protein DFJ73DRAFT_793725 [Zopfochytrium polystomum]
MKSATRASRSLRTRRKWSERYKFGNPASGGGTLPPSWSVDDPSSIASRTTTLRFATPPLEVTRRDAVHTPVLAKHDPQYPVSRMISTGDLRVVLHVLDEKRRAVEVEGVMAVSVIGAPREEFVRLVDAYRRLTTRRSAMQSPSLLQSIGMKFAATAAATALLSTAFVAGAMAAETYYNVNCGETLNGPPVQTYQFFFELDNPTIAYSPGNLNSPKEVALVANGPNYWEGTCTTVTYPSGKKTVECINAAPGTDTNSVIGSLAYTTDGPQGTTLQCRKGEVQYITYQGRPCRAYYPCSSDFGPDCKPGDNNYPYCA